MTRSGMDETWRAVLYSGCFWKRLEFSRVEASSVFLLDLLSKLHAASIA
jgi:hypothetical protein